jgi:DHA1 family bicyclomycin/chloramphenicol resistance-like MFS transporter
VLQARRPGTVYLVALAALGSSSVHIVLPSIPSTARDLGTSTATIQATLTAFTLMMAVGPLIYGPVSDRLGRLKPLFFGLGIFLLGCTLCAAATSTPMLVAGRMLQGAGGCAGVVIARAMIRDLYDAQRAVRMLANVTMGVSISPILSPLLGGQIDELVGWRGSFIFLATVCVIVLAASLHLAETRPASTRSVASRSVLSDFIGLFRIPVFWRCMGGFALAAFAFFVFITTVPVIMAVKLGYTPGDYGLYYMMVPGSFLMGNMLGKRFARSLTMWRQVVVSFTLAVASGVLMVVWVGIDGPSPWSLFVPFALVNLSQGTGWPALTNLVLSADPARTGSASGLFGFTQMASASVSTLVSGLLGPESALPLAVLVAACAIGSALFLVQGRNGHLR